MTESMQLVKEIIDSQYFGVLNSTGEGQPYSNLVAFAADNELKSLIFCTDRNTRKYRNIKENGAVSLLIDNRTNQPSDIAQAVAITVLGNARENVNQEFHFKALFLARHPHLKDFINAPTSTLILITVQEYIIAGFNTTQRVVIAQ